MSRKIVITSGKGGVGKTTIVCCLGKSLAKMGYKTLLIDMDFGLNNLDLLMGVENKIIYDIIDVIEKKCLPKQAIIEDFNNKDLFVFPSTHSFCSVKFGSKELLQIINDLDEMFDFILIDCPAGLDGGYRRAIECADEYIVVTTPHISAVRDASKILLSIKNKMNSSSYLIINRVRGDLVVDGSMIDTKLIANYLQATLIGIIPDDDFVCKQLLVGGDLKCDCDAQKSLNLIAENLLLGCGEFKIFDCTKKYRGLFGGIRKNLKKVL